MGTVSSELSPSTASLKMTDDEKTVTIPARNKAK